MLREKYGPMVNGWHNVNNMTRYLTYKVYANFKGSINLSTIDSRYDAKNTYKKEPRQEMVGHLCKMVRTNGQVKLKVMLIKRKCGI